MLTSARCLFARRVGARVVLSQPKVVPPKIPCQIAGLHASARAMNSESSVKHAGSTVPLPRRTHTCGALAPENAEEHVVLTGWFSSRGQMSKRFSFFQLRDSYGATQLIADVRTCGEEVLSAMRKIPNGSTILVEGTVRVRPKGQRRDVPAGHIEVAVKSFALLNPADRNLPYDPEDNLNLANEELRLNYRYLDLRRSELMENLKKRSDVAFLVRSTLHDEGFTEVETPMLLNSSPEGAREYLVPVRARRPRTGEPVQPMFYALSQSPQQPKQLLVASGAVDRYYQIARCFRDEDGRSDRQPEFTQLDLEMAWVSWGNDLAAPEDPWRIGGHEVRDIVETIVRKVWRKFEGRELEDRFRVMTYDEAMSRYGSDKPDLRYGMEIKNVTDMLPPTLRAAFEAQGQILEALVPEFPLDDPSAFMPEGVERIGVPSKPSSPNPDLWLLQESSIIRSTLGSDVPDLPELRDFGLTKQLKLEQGGHLFLAKRKARPEGGSTNLGVLRSWLVNRVNQDHPNTVEVSNDPKFLWVTEFPLFTHADADKDFLAHGRWSSSHHPFTAPMREDIERLYSGQIEEVRGQHYDLVLNGQEIGGGSVRVHDAAMQEYIFSQVLQLDEKEKASFNHLLQALRFGAAPHGGFAFGFDRLMAILCKSSSIRDVIAFPKTQFGRDLLFKSPSPSSPEVLAQYALRPL
ncbi:tRNA synthetases class II-domain-containing protein [Cerioporus squamosus]|nr:tRNA synthetases class II-domain-containing protein [Cerioporus squamosus]